ncbi:MAG: hypothetical protein Q4C49_05730 [Bacillota bacterium]|nr:hypothetical protein [Bacillota bacterium]
MEFQIKVVNTIFHIDSINLTGESFFKDYLVTSQHSDYFLSIKEEDILYEKEMGYVLDLHGKRIDRHFSKEICESLAIQRKVSQILFEKDVILLHGELIGVGNEGYILTAKSGVGKSTRALKWIENIPCAYIVDGDKPFLSIGEEIIGYGTPWCGKEGLNTNTSIRIKGICFLSRNKEYSIEEVGISQVFSRLLYQVHLPDPKDTVKMIQLLNKMSQSVKFYDLQCDRSTQSAIRTYQYISNN